MDINYTVLLITAILMAVVYGVVGYLQAKAKSGADWEWSKFAATIVYSVVVGFVAVSTGLLTLQNVDMNVIVAVWATYIGYLTMAQTLLDAIIAFIFKQPLGLATAFVRKR